MNNFNINGLTQEEVLKAREKDGFNTLEYKKENGLIDAFTRIAKEPMVILLLGLLIYLKPLTRFFQFESLNLSQFIISVGLGFLMVIWYEIIKWNKRASQI